MANADAVDEFQISVTETTFLTLEPIPEILRRSIVPLVEAAQTDEGDVIIEPVGTAFVLCQLASGQALLATANHKIPEGPLQEGRKLVILLPRPGIDGSGLMGLGVSGISRYESSSDVALMATAIDDSVVTPVLMPLSLEIPQLGENCLALGYSQLTIGKATGFEAQAQVRLSSSRGEIEEVYPSRRDSVKVTFPSFRTDAFYEQGMSGGPVFGMSGGVIGLVSTCMESRDDGVPHTSHVALTAGLLELGIPEEGISESRIGDLVATGRLRMVREKTTTVTRSEDGTVTVTWPDGDVIG